MIGTILATLGIVGLLVIGVAGVLAPQRASTEYGIVLGDARALGFVRAIAARDVAIAGLLAIVALSATRSMLGWAMCLAALIAAVDLLVVMADRRTTARARIDRATLLHGGGALGLLVAGGVLVAGY